MTNFKKSILAATAAMSLASVAFAQPAGQTAPEGTIDPAVWKVADEDTTIYLVGTFHMLPEDLQWRTDTIDNALAASDDVYFEISDDLSNPSAIMPIVQELAITPGQPSLAERVGEENAKKIADFVTPAGIPAQALDVMDSWFIGLTLANVASMQLGYDGEAGVEQTLRRDIEARGLEIKGLETAREQLSHLDTMPQEAQDKWLTMTAEGIENFEADFNRLRTAWERGDEDEVNAIFDEQTPLGSDMRVSLLTNRNTDWTGDLVARMDEPGTVFVAVGLGHLVGGDSVVQMLTDKGFTVTRIDD